ncbi:MAG: DUF2789 domain-containing protein [Pseudohongiella sp.]|nr:DUF2789 domain-containing protein [Pseudohongiella sp.]MDP2285988.1 DUF2789 domain-containing protein [Pseudohongiella sp.]
MSFHSMTDLFMQLGLASDAESIASFIHSHQLPAEVRLCDAPFWTESQRQFLTEQFRADASWIIIVDQLNESLHEDAVKQQSL